MSYDLTYMGNLGDLVFNEKVLDIMPKIQSVKRN